MRTLLEERLRIILLLLPLSHLKILLWILVPVVEGISVHNTHVVNNVHPSLSEVADDKVSPLL